jgi:hypothetical protein
MNSYDEICVDRFYKKHMFMVAIIGNDPKRDCTEVTPTSIARRVCRTDSTQPCDTNNTFIV